MLKSFHLCETHRWRVRRYRHLRFQPGLNLLIGPNGTGKSTILRALANCPHCRRVEDTPATYHYFDAEAMNPRRADTPVRNPTEMKLHLRAMFSSHGEILQALFSTLRLAPGACLLLDEPESGQDFDHVLALRAAMDRAIRRGVQIIAATHQILFWERAHIIELRRNYCDYVTQTLCQMRCLRPPGDPRAMNIQLECIPCFARQAMEAVAEVVTDPVQRETLLRRLLHEVADADWSSSPPAIAQQLHRAIRRALKNDDPYRDIKNRMNRMAAELLPAIRERIAQDPDPREAAIRVAIAGNLLDAGAQTQISAEELPAHLDAIWNRPLRGDVIGFLRAVERARNILFLADNAGEIFFDLLLLEQLPAEKITVFVRGAPVLNDATAADAEAAGIDAIAPVLDTGSDAPGTILEDCSENFRAWFDRADLIIAKGQGNYETLSNVAKNIYFLFIVKCPPVAEKIGEPVGSLVVKSAQTPPEELS